MDIQSNGSLPHRQPQHNRLPLGRGNRHGTRRVDLCTKRDVRTEADADEVLPGVRLGQRGRPACGIGTGRRAEGRAVEGQRGSGRLVQFGLLAGRQV